MVRALIVVFLFIGGSCQRYDHTEVEKNSVSDVTESFQDKIPGNGALLLTCFNSFPQFKSAVELEYIKVHPVFSNITEPQVRLTYECGDRKVTSVLKDGVCETDFTRARDGYFWDKISIALRSPYALMHRRQLKSIESLGRKRPWVFGKGDVAFYHLAEAMVHHISEQDRVDMTIANLSEKGYLNTFNHITAQAFMTSIFSEKIADFVADVHERAKMPELITGVFTENQIKDLENGPVDNYLDMINNEWGQELGKILRIKYSIGPGTHWTPTLLADYLNDIQSYHSWAFQIGFRPFKPTDEIVIRFAGKLNKVLTGV